MKALFFFPKIENSYRVSYAPLGIMSIATYLNANGHEAHICDRFFSKETVEELLEKYKPDFVGVSVISHSFLNDAMYISRIAKSADIKVVWGGTFTTEIYKQILDSGCADYVSRYEGEYTWLDMANAYDNKESFENIKGLAYVKNGEYVYSGDREFVDLTTLPSVDWSLVDPNNYLQKSYGCSRQLNIYYSKGCPGRCTYCFNPVLNHSIRRSRPIKQVIDEMEHLSKTYGADGFDFADDCMFLKSEEIHEFCNALIERKLNVVWSSYLSVGIANKLEDYEIMYKSGCRSLIFGIESGSEKILKSVNKLSRLHLVKPNIDLCVQSGIVPITAFMIGFPDEDVDDLNATLDLAKSLKGTAILYNFFTPAPGAKIYNELVSKGKIKAEYTLDEFAATKEWETLSWNFTNVKTIDLICIKKYIRLRTLLTPVGNSTGEQSSKVLLSTLKSWYSRGLIQFFKSFVNAVFNVLSTFSIFAHPKIRKRYGLYFTK